MIAAIKRNLKKEKQLYLVFYNTFTLKPNYVIIPFLKISKFCMWVVKGGLKNIPKKKM